MAINILTWFSLSDWNFLKAIGPQQYQCMKRDTREIVWELRKIVLFCHLDFEQMTTGWDSKFMTKSQSLLLCFFPVPACQYFLQRVIKNFRFSPLDSIWIYKARIEKIWWLYMPYNAKFPQERKHCFFRPID